VEAAQVQARNQVLPGFGGELHMVAAASEVPHIQEPHMHLLQVGPHIQELELHNLEQLLEDHSLEHQVPGLHNQVLGLHNQVQGLHIQVQGLHRQEAVAS
jgi:hypothetical protein